jgi:hypothetical protein
MPCRYHSLPCFFLCPVQSDGPKFDLLQQSGIKRPPPSRAHLGISEIMDDVRDRFLGISQSNTHPEFLARFEAEEEAFLSRIVSLQQMKPGSIILNRRQKGAGQVMVPTGHTCTCLSFAQGCRSGRRLCGKIGFGDNPSRLNMCYFHNF